VWSVANGRYFDDSSGAYHDADDYDYNAVTGAYYDADGRHVADGDSSSPW
jgi:hypothetical protein